MVNWLVRVDIYRGDFKNFEFFDTADGPIEVYKSWEICTLLGRECIKICQVELPGCVRETSLAQRGQSVVMEDSSVVGLASWLGGLEGEAHNVV